MLIILFGLTGAGKNFVGETIEKHFKFHFWDADEALPESMHKAIQKKMSFTQEMRDEFAEIMIEKIKLKQKDHPNLVVAQALYKRQNRAQIHAALPDATFIWVRANSIKINQRLAERKDEIDCQYAHKIRTNFEAPELTKEEWVVINNTNQEAVIKQIDNIFQANHLYQDKAQSIKYA